MIIKACSTPHCERLAGFSSLKNAASSDLLHWPTSVTKMLENVQKLLPKSGRGLRVLLGASLGEEPVGLGAATSHSSNAMAHWSLCGVAAEMQIFTTPNSPFTFSK